MELSSTLQAVYEEAAGLHLPSHDMTLLSDVCKIFF